MTNKRDGSGFSIGQVAKAADVHVETVRFYERQGLIQQPEKPYLGIRRYPPDIVARIRFIKHGQSLGFTLQEVRELLALRPDSPDTCATVQHRAEVKLRTVREKLMALQTMESVLEQLIRSCGQGDTVRHACPILQVMDAGWANTPAEHWEKPIHQGESHAP